MSSEIHIESSKPIEHYKEKKKKKFEQMVETCPAHTDKGFCTVMDVSCLTTYEYHGKCPFLHWKKWEE
jgi:hypothetical protein